MKTIRLTKGYEAEVDDDDFLRVSQFKWHVAEVKRRDGSVRNVYARRSTGKYTNQLLHRFILGVEGDVEVDHRDNYGLNCQRGNLRMATGSQNHGNMRRRLGTSSQYKGVSWQKHDKVWVAFIGIKGKPTYLGCFHVEREAALAYDAAAREHFGKDFAATNFKEETK